MAPDMRSENLTYSGFWKRCNYVNQTCESTIPFFTQRTGWQDGALCILLFAILLGLLGISLALAGHVVYALSKRLYYFHSGGEAHVVAAFVTALSVLIYHVTVVVHQQNHSGPITFGAAYGFTWFGCFLHLLAALLLFLDELLHRLATQLTRVKCVQVCLNCLIGFYTRVHERQLKRQEKRRQQTYVSSGRTSVRSVDYLKPSRVSMGGGAGGPTRS
ncbi:hypothetical protein EG68_00835 [Paragonimus skrjabini miyazakii]|uniref:Uncharacterized protein n=1 Tax=Paragonimus skrjabini miyazakii TaxID=59628 RepID=A0A8S9Z906_9TREM|nr:hypothetical protein EG68_00835 [Paragonimus skrjabini miyazakii]